MFTVEARKEVLRYIAENEQYREALGVSPGSLVTAAKSEDGEVKKYYTLNQTGSIMISSTAEKEAEVSDEVRSVFKKVVVFFAAWTAALSKKKRRSTMRMR